MNEFSHIPHAIMEEKHFIGQHEMVVYTLLAIKRDIFNAKIELREEEYDQYFLFMRDLDNHEGRNHLRNQQYKVIFSDEDGKVYENPGINFKDYYKNQLETFLKNRNRHERA